MKLSEEQLCKMMEAARGVMGKGEPFCLVLSAGGHGAGLLDPNGSTKLDAKVVASMMIAAIELVRNAGNQTANPEAFVQDVNHCIEELYNKGGMKR